ncbi:TIM barrel protein [Candidatus Gracilibacteria bacterium]|nr:TIM barrel protein [Candidatus Gracilibacteria bacterium]
MAALAPVRFAVSIERIFTDKPFEQRMEYVADQGFKAFEFGLRKGKDMNITHALRMALRLEVSAFEATAIPLTDPAQRKAALAEVERSAALAIDLACPTLIVASGHTTVGLSRDEQRRHLVDTLAEAAETAADADLVLALQPQNTIDCPESFLWSMDEAATIVRAIDSPNVQLCFNVYHQQISEGNLSKRLSEYLPLIAHVQVADVPGRHEPGSGEINYEHIFGLLRERGYRGYIGLDYLPLLDPIVSLRAVRALGT